MLEELSGASPHTLSDEALLVDDLGMDSLGVAELYARAESRFGIRIDPGEAVRCERVGEVGALIAARLERVRA
jgi:acyl carrier protein